ncbi:hypothetical protein IGI84_002126 [Enterococcus sp. DIV0008]|uniref:metallophosphoesterase n=1 Tax=unclassified Enterococcus TaxID=2608891 RepID=UPI003D2FA07D
MYTLILIAFLLTGLLVYSFIIEPHLLKQRHYLIKKDKRTVLDISKAYDLYQAESNIVIAHISDLHFSRWFKPRRMNRIIRSTIQNKPDLIIITGDLIDNYKKWPHRSTKRLIEKLKKLQAPLGKIAVMGNHDHLNDGHYFVKEIYQHAGFTLLDNESVFGSDDKTSMNIVGIDIESPKVSFTYEATLAEWQLLLLHEPDYVSRITNLPNYDLILSGHSHGGQIRLPFYYAKTKGALKYTDGLYLLGKETLLSVSSGVGMTKIPARLGVPPEILYYHLEPQQQSNVS